MTFIFFLHHRTNPIVELFNGHSKTEGVLNGQNFTNESRFGAFPVQVQGHTHLHDSLDASTYTAELNQETWFTRLPPILVLELSRFQFNQVPIVHSMSPFGAYYGGGGGDFAIKSMTKKKMYTV